MRRRVLSCLPAIAALLATPALADDSCKPLQIITSVPLTSMGAGVVGMPVSFNGVTKQFLFDTGGSLPQVSMKMVDELMLPKLESRIQLFAVNGARSDYYTKVENFQVGAMRFGKLDIPISTFNFDGIFSPVGFPAYDFEVDITGAKLNILSGDHCDGKVIYWPSKALAVVPMTTRDFHVNIPVTLDGHDLTAVVDTGASTSTVRLDIARSVFKIDPQSPDLKPAGHIGNDESAPVYSYPFKTLTFDSITVNNPKILVLTDIVNKSVDHSFDTTTRATRNNADLKLPEVIIGMDVLRKLHLYFAFKEKRLYMTEASTPPPAAPASGNPPKSQ